MAITFQVILCIHLIPFKYKSTKKVAIMTYLSSLLIIVPTLLSALSIDEAVQQTIETNPQIQIKQQELLIEERTLGIAKSDYLPKVDISYSAGPEITHTIANKGDTTQDSREDNIRQEGSFNVTQNVFAGFDTINAVKQQEALILSAGNNVKDNANSIALETVTTYIDILRNKELLDIAEENMNVHKKYLAQIKEKLEAGVGRSSDYKQTLSRYESAQSIYLLSEQNYKNSISTFQRILPVEVTASDLLKPTIGSLPSPTLEGLIELSMKNNPSIHVSEADIKFAESALARSNATYYPQADIAAQAYWNKDLNGLRVNPAEQDGYNVLLILSYNIFNGLADKSYIEANRHRVFKQNSALADNKRYVEAYTKIAWNTFKSTKEQLIHIEKNIQASAETVSDYQEEHDLGRRSIIDLLNIELEYNNAKNRKVAAEYDRLVAYYQILTHTGTMLKTMSITIER